ncbi:DUF58 domain-containing protein [Reyranella sp. CPCC 100927]|uniref:DUF58 domain-containing protein n=1 Tax=Reyranella sp. CPCC 100927 TaxID=2599616 RepID=UPI0011B47602|nr:DUF58 domain-containing protein [Reyranella sp. CPCC 100927]TWT15666.1 DUF58 domain-containing protein [Reyranella sp. CPCC 100927]
MAAAATSSLTDAARLASALPPLLVAAQRVASTVMQGVHGRRRVGQGDAFWQFRQYRPGDAINRIDWRQTAKSRAVYVRETEWEAAASVWLWRDGSPSMDFASGRNVPKKKHRAEVLLLALSTLLVDAGERVALLGGNDRPSSGRAVPRRLVGTLSDNALLGANESTPPRVPLPAHGHVVLIGDLLDPLEQIEAVVRHYAAHGVHGHLVQVLDPAEEDLPYDGHVKFSGLEREGDHTIRKVEAVREAYQARLVAQKEGLQRIAQSVAWTWRPHRTDRSPETALLSLYMAMADTGRRA